MEKAKDTTFHAAIYVNKFKTVYEKLDKDGLVFKKHRFSDKCNTLQEALNGCQFRYSQLPSHKLKIDIYTRTKLCSLRVIYFSLLLVHCYVLIGRSKTIRSPKESTEKASWFYFEHEVRSMFHPSFHRPLVNRFGRTGIFCNQ